MAKPLFSNFAFDGTADNTLSLFQGASTGSTTLIEELDELEEEVMWVASTDGLPNSGWLVVEDELIFYSARFGWDQIRELQRGLQGTSSVTHPVDAVVEFHPNYYIPPALIEAIIEMQETILDQHDRLTVLEGA